MQPTAEAVAEWRNKASPEAGERKRAEKGLRFPLARYFGWWNCETGNALVARFAPELETWLGLCGCFLSPLRGLLVFRFLPTAGAVGCILTPLRGSVSVAQTLW